MDPASTVPEAAEYKGSDEDFPTLGGAQAQPRGNRGSRASRESGMIKGIGIEGQIHADRVHANTVSFAFRGCSPRSISASLLFVVTYPQSSAGRSSLFRPLAFDPRCPWACECLLCGELQQCEKDNGLLIVMAALSSQSVIQLSGRS